MIVNVEIAVSGLRCCVVLLSNTSVLEEWAASVIRVEMCSFRNKD
jgi:hypothetical protein